MLGEKIAETKGKVTNTRVLETSPQPKVETTFEATGKILGIEAKEVGTYWSVMQTSGVLNGEGHGVIMTKEGVATWSGGGVGKITTTGRTSYRGAIYYKTTVERLLPLNGIAAVFEYEVDENGNTQAQIFEWK